MTKVGLSPREIGLIRSVLRRFPDVTEAVLYGSRAKGTFHLASDIDLALIGVDNDLAAEAVAAELDELPLPYRFDVMAYHSVQHEGLCEHIDRVGIVLYRRGSAD